MTRDQYRWVGQHGDDDLAITGSISTTPAIDVRYATRGTIYIEAASAATLLTYYGCEKEDGTYHPLSSGDPTPVAEAITVAHTNCYALPASCFGCGFIKIVGNNTATVKVSFKG